MKKDSIVPISEKRSRMGIFRPVALSFVLLAVTVMTSQAQGLHLGVKAGANIMKIDGESFNSDFNYGYNVGAFAQINLPGMIGFQPEVNFNQTPYHTGNQFSDIYPSNADDVKGKLNYLSIPVLLAIRPIKFISILVGPQFGIALNSNQHLLTNGQDAFKKGDVSAVGGAQLNLANFIVGARYVVGLSNVREASTDNSVTVSENWKNQGFQVYVGLRFF